MKGLLCASAALMAAPLVAPSANAQMQGASCGDTITVNTVLQQDLVCGSEEAGLVVQGPATVDLGGNTIECLGDGDTCLVLTGSGARLQNGTVDAPTRLDLRLLGEGGHRIQDVRAESGPSPAIQISSDGNSIIDSQSSGDAALSISGSNNIIANTEVESQFVALGVAGSRNLLFGNNIRSLAFPLGVSGQGNVFVSNVFEDSVDSNWSSVSGDYSHMIGNAFLKQVGFFSLVISGDHGVFIGHRIIAASLSNG